MTEAHERLPYLAARIQEALAQDSRVGELGIHVEVDGHEVRVSGVVSTPERRDAIREVVHEIAKGYRFTNATSVFRVHPHTEAEVLP